MKPQAQRDYDALMAKERKARVAELATHGTETLAEFGADLENMLKVQRDEITELENEAAELRQELADCQNGDIAGLLLDLSSAISVDDELTRRAMLTGGEIDQSLRDDIREMTWNLLLKVSPLTDVNVDDVYESVRV